jgi:hypothetical protein
VLLAAPHGPVRRVLGLAGLDRVFHVHASVAAARHDEDDRAARYGAGNEFGPAG